MSGQNMRGGRRRGQISQTDEDTEDESPIGTQRQTRSSNLASNDRPHRDNAPHASNQTRASPSKANNSKVEESPTKKRKSQSQKKAPSEKQAQSVERNVERQTKVKQSPTKADYSDDNESPIRTTRGRLRKRGQSDKNSQGAERNNEVQTKRQSKSGPKEDEVFNPPSEKESRSPKNKRIHAKNVDRVSKVQDSVSEINQTDTSVERSDQEEGSSSQSVQKTDTAPNSVQEKQDVPPNIKESQETGRRPRSQLKTDSVPDPALGELELSPKTGRSQEEKSRSWSQQRTDPTVNPIQEISDLSPKLNRNSQEVDGRLRSRQHMDSPSHPSQEEQVNSKSQEEDCSLLSRQKSNPADNPKQKDKDLSPANSKRTQEERGRSRTRQKTDLASYPTQKDSNLSTVSSQRIQEEKGRSRSRQRIDSTPNLLQENRDLTPINNRSQEDIIGRPQSSQKDQVQPNPIQKEEPLSPKQSRSCVRNVDKISKTRKSRSQHRPSKDNSLERSSQAQTGRSNSRNTAATVASHRGRFSEPEENNPLHIKKEDLSPKQTRSRRSRSVDRVSKERQSRSRSKKQVNEESTSDQDDGNWSPESSKRNRSRSVDRVSKERQSSSYCSRKKGLETMSHQEYQDWLSNPNCRSGRPWRKPSDSLESPDIEEEKRSSRNSRGRSRSWDRVSKVRESRLQSQQTDDDDDGDSPEEDRPPNNSRRGRARSVDRMSRVGEFSQRPPIEPSGYESDHGLSVHRRGRSEIKGKFRPRSRSLDRLSKYRESASVNAERISSVSTVNGPNFEKVNKYMSKWQRKVSPNKRPLIASDCFIIDADDVAPNFTSNGAAAVVIDCQPHIDRHTNTRTPIGVTSPLPRPKPVISAKPWHKKPIVSDRYPEEGRSYTKQPKPSVIEASGELECEFCTDAFPSYSDLEDHYLQHFTSLPKLNAFLNSRRARYSCSDTSSLDTGQQSQPDSSPDKGSNKRTVRFGVNEGVGTGKPKTGSRPVVHGASAYRNNDIPQVTNTDITNVANTDRERGISHELDTDRDISHKDDIHINKALSSKTGQSRQFRKKDKDKETKGIDSHEKVFEVSSDPSLSPNGTTTELCGVNDIPSPIDTEQDTDEESHWSKSQSEPEEQTEDCVEETESQIETETDDSEMDDISEHERNSTSVLDSSVKLSNTSEVFDSFTEELNNSAAQVVELCKRKTLKICLKKLHPCDYRQYWLEKYGYSSSDSPHSTPDLERIVNSEDLSDRDHAFTADVTQTNTPLQSDKDAVLPNTDGDNVAMCASHVGDTNDSHTKTVDSEFRNNLLCDNHAGKSMDKSGSPSVKKKYRSAKAQQIIKEKASQQIKVLSYNSVSSSKTINNHHVLELSSEVERNLENSFPKASATVSDDRIKDAGQSTDSSTETETDKGAIDNTQVMDNQIPEMQSDTLEKKVSKKRKRSKEKSGTTLPNKKANTEISEDSETLSDKVDGADDLESEDRTKIDSSDASSVTNTSASSKSKSKNKISSFAIKNNSIPSVVENVTEHLEEKEESSITKTNKMESEAHKFNSVFKEMLNKPVKERSSKTKTNKKGSKIPNENSVLRRMLNKSVSVSADKTSDENIAKKHGELTKQHQTESEIIDKQIQSVEETENRTPSPDLETKMENLSSLVNDIRRSPRRKIRPKRYVDGSEISFESFDDIEVQADYDTDINTSGTISYSPVASNGVVSSSKDAPREEAVASSLGASVQKESVDSDKDKDSLPNNSLHIEHESSTDIYDSSNPDSLTNFASSKVKKTRKTRGKKKDASKAIADSDTTLDSVKMPAQKERKCKKGKTAKANNLRKTLDERSLTDFTLESEMLVSESEDPFLTDRRKNSLLTEDDDDVKRSALNVLLSQDFNIVESSSFDTGFQSPYPDNNTKQVICPLDDDMLFNDVISPKADMILDDEDLPIIECLALLKKDNPSVNENLSVERSGDEPDSGNVPETLKPAVSSSRPKCKKKPRQLLIEDKSSSPLTAALKETCRLMEQENIMDRVESPKMKLFNDSEVPVLALPVHYPSADLFKEALSSTDNDTTFYLSGTESVGHSPQKQNRRSLHRCEVCNMRFKSMDLLQSHATQMHYHAVGTDIEPDQPPQSECLVCKAQFGSEQELTAHKDTCGVHSPDTHGIQSADVNSNSTKVDLNNLVKKERETGRLVAAKFVSPQNINKDLISETICDPVISVSPVKPVSPAKSLTPVKPVTPVKSLTLAKHVSPVRSMTPIKHLSPSKPVSPVKFVTPVKSVTPVKILSPAKSISPVKSVTPVKILSPAKSISPVKSVTPVKSVSPVKYMSTVKTTETSDSASYIKNKLDLPSDVSKIPCLYCGKKIRVSRIDKHKCKASRINKDSSTDSMEISRSDFMGNKCMSMNQSKANLKIKIKGNRIVEEPVDEKVKKTVVEATDVLAENKTVKEIDTEVLVGKEAGIENVKDMLSDNNTGKEKDRELLNDKENQNSCDLPGTDFDLNKSRSSQIPEGKFKVFKGEGEMKIILKKVELKTFKLNELCLKFCGSPVSPRWKLKSFNHLTHVVCLEKDKTVKRTDRERKSISDSDNLGKTSGRDTVETQSDSLKEDHSDKSTVGVSKDVNHGHSHKVPNKKSKEKKTKDLTSKSKPKGDLTDFEKAIMSNAKDVSAKSKVKRSKQMSGDKVLSRQNSAEASHPSDTNSLQEANRELVLKKKAKTRDTGVVVHPFHNSKTAQRIYKEAQRKAAQQDGDPDFPDIAQAKSGVDVLQSFSEILDSKKEENNKKTTKPVLSDSVISARSLKSDLESIGIVANKPNPKLKDMMGPLKFNRSFGMLKSPLKRNWLGDSDQPVLKIPRLSSNQDTASVNNNKWPGLRQGQMMFKSPLDSCYNEPGLSQWGKADSNKSTVTNLNKTFPITATPSYNDFLYKQFIDVKLPNEKGDNTESNHGDQQNESNNLPSSAATEKSGRTKFKISRYEIPGDAPNPMETIMRISLGNLDNPEGVGKSHGEVDDDDQETYTATPLVTENFTIEASPGIKAKRTVKIKNKTTDTSGQQSSHIEYKDLKHPEGELVICDSLTELDYDGSVIENKSRHPSGISETDSYDRLLVTRSISVDRSVADVDGLDSEMVDSNHTAETVQYEDNPPVDFRDHSTPYCDKLDKTSGIHDIQHLKKISCKLRNNFVIDGEKANTPSTIYSEESYKGLDNKDNHENTITTGQFSYMDRNSVESSRTTCVPDYNSQHNNSVEIATVTKDKAGESLQESDDNAHGCDNDNAIDMGDHEDEFSVCDSDNADDDFDDNADDNADDNDEIADDAGDSNEEEGDDDDDGDDDGDGSHEVDNEVDDYDNQVAGKGEIEVTETTTEGLTADGSPVVNKDDDDEISLDYEDDDVLDLFAPDDASFLDSDSVIEEPVVEKNNVDSRGSPDNGTTCSSPVDMEVESQGSPSHIDSNIEVDVPDSRPRETGGPGPPQGPHRTRWIPPTFCFKFCNNQPCMKNCRFRHVFPDQDTLLKHLPLVKEALKSGKYDNALWMLSSHDILAERLPPPDVINFYRLSVRNKNVDGAHMLLKLMYNRQLITQSAIDDFICQFSSDSVNGNFLWDIFQMAKALNIQPKLHSSNLLLRVFKEAQAWRPLWDVLQYLMENDAYSVPLTYIQAALEATVENPSAYLQQTVAWLYEADQELLKTLNTHVLQRLCDVLKRHKHDEVAQTLEQLWRPRDQPGFSRQGPSLLGNPRNVTPPLLGQRTRSATPTDHAPPSAFSRVKGQEDIGDQDLLVRNIQSVQYIRNWDYLGDLFVDVISAQSSPDTALLEEFCRALSKDPSHIPAAFKQFLFRVKKLMEKDLKMKSRALVDVHSLVNVGNELIIMCHKRGLWMEGRELISIQLKQGILSLEPANMAATALKICINARDSGLAEEVLQGVDFGLAPAPVQKCMLNMFPDLIDLMLASGSLTGCYNLVAMLFEIIFSDQAGQMVDQNALCLNNITASLVQRCLETNQCQAAVSVYKLYISRSIPFSIHISLKRRLLATMMSNRLHEYGRHLYEDLKKNDDVYVVQVLECPRVMELNACLTQPEIYLIVKDYLFDLYKYFCDEIMENKMLNQRDLNLQIYIDYQQQPQNLEQLADKISEGSVRDILQHHFEPPLQTTFSNHDNKIHITHASLEAYLQLLDKNGKGADKASYFNNFPMIDDRHREELEQAEQELEQEESDLDNRSR